MITDEQLKAIRERAEAATPGPWVQGDGTDDRFYEGKYAIFANVDIGKDTERIILFAKVNTNFPSLENSAAFIAAARSDIPALLDEVDDLRRQLAEMTARAERAEKALKELQALYDSNLEGLATIGVVREPIMSGAEIVGYRWVNKRAENVEAEARKERKIEGEKYYTKWQKVVMAPDLVAFVSPADEAEIDLFFLDEVGRMGYSIAKDEVATLVKALKGETHVRNV